MSRAKNYHRDRARIKNGTEFGKFVVELDGLFKRSGTDARYRFGTFEQAHIYATLKRAQNAAEKGQGCVVMALMSTESFTRLNHAEGA